MTYSLIVPKLIYDFGFCDIIFQKKTCTNQIKLYTFIMNLGLGSKINMKTEMLDM